MNLAEKKQQAERMQAIRSVGSELFLSEVHREHLLDDMDALRGFMLRCFAVAEMLVDYGKEMVEPFL